MRGEKKTIKIHDGGGRWKSERESESEKQKTLVTQNPRLRPRFYVNISRREGEKKKGRRKI